MSSLKDYMESVMQEAKEHQAKPQPPLKYTSKKDEKKQPKPSKKTGTKKGGKRHKSRRSK